MSSRKSYRNKLIRKDLLEVIFSGGGAGAEGSLLDVHGSGAAAVFKEPSKGSLKPGMQGSLTFRSPQSEESFELPVMVRSVRDIRGGVRVGFSFDQQSAFGVQWPESMRALFNRRGAYRVEPRPREEVPLLIRADYGDRGSITLRGKLADISLTGARVLLNDALEDIELPLKVRATFLLPQTQIRVMISAILRNSYGDNKHQAGLQFLEDNSPRFGINQKEIREYIMQRQREDLRRMSWLNKRDSDNDSSKKS